MRGHIILSHGSDSSPEATKVSALAAQAEAAGWSTARPDYRDDDRHGHAACVPLRVARLLAAIDAAPTRPLLVGSSMGAFVTGLASLQRPLAGAFLLATPTAIPGHPQPFDLAPELPAWLVHGWNDGICPPDAVLAFAQARRLPLLMLDDDHRLLRGMDAIAANFACLLGVPAA